TGWDLSVDNDGDGNAWTLYSGPSHSGADFQGLIVPSTTNNVDDWFFTKCLNLTATHTYNVKFWKRTFRSTFDGNLEIKIGNNQTSAAMSQTIEAATDVTNLTYVLDSTNFMVATDGIYFIGFGASKGAVASDSTLIFIDDIT